MEYLGTLYNTGMNSSIVYYVQSVPPSLSSSIAL